MSDRWPVCVIGLGPALVRWGDPAPQGVPGDRWQGQAIGAWVGGLLLPAVLGRQGGGDGVLWAHMESGLLCSKCLNSRNSDRVQQSLAQCGPLRHPTGRDRPSSRLGTSSRGPSGELVVQGGSGPFPSGLRAGRPRTPDLPGLHGCLAVCSAGGRVQKENFGEFAVIFSSR